jgi:hypothetical protein
MQAWEVIHEFACLQGLGVKEYHRSCTDNLHEGLQELGLTPPEVPSPFNLCEHALPLCCPVSNLPGLQAWCCSPH